MFLEKIAFGKVEMVTILGDRKPYLDDRTTFFLLDFRFQGEDDLIDLSALWPWRTAQPQINYMTWPEYPIYLRAFLAYKNKEEPDYHVFAWAASIVRCFVRKTSAYL